MGKALRAIWLAFIIMGISGGAAQAKLKVGLPAPDFQATTFDGSKLHLADFKGQVLVINIWATWCGPCKQELPLLDAYYASAAPWGLRVIAITTEDSIPANRLKPLQGALRIPLARYFKGQYNVLKGAVPTNFIIDRAGILRYAQPGAFDLEQLNTLLIPLLKEPVPADAATAAQSGT